jgi:hypothetical protein
MSDQLAKLLENLQRASTDRDYDAVVTIADKGAEFVLLRSRRSINFPTKQCWRLIRVTLMHSLVNYVLSLR